MKDREVGGTGTGQKGPQGRAKERGGDSGGQRGPWPCRKRTLRRGQRPAEVPGVRGT